MLSPAFWLSVVSVFLVLRWVSRGVAALPELRIRRVVPQHARVQAVTLASRSESARLRDAA